ncbi:hypothetical protein GCM10027039_33710 [Terrabacter koreensis]
MPVVGAWGVYETGDATERRDSPTRSGVGAAGLGAAEVECSVCEVVTAPGADEGVGPPQAAASSVAAATATAARPRRVLTSSV